MSDSINDGGPAFPRTKSTGNLSNSTTEIVSVGGMSLRDWFAGQALAGLASNQSFLLNILDGHTHNNTEDALAFTAFRTADAMLAARNKEVAP